MKILSTIQELWEYCLFCHICHSPWRNLYIHVGSPNKIKLIRFKKTSELLKLTCIAFIKEKQYSINYNVNCLSNTCSVELLNHNGILEENIQLIEKSLPLFYFHIQTECRVCGINFANSLDIELDNRSSKFSNIGMDSETIYFLGQEDKYHLTLLYNSDKMLISKCFSEHGGIIDNNVVHTAPLINLDLSDHQKTVNRIKTLLVFS